MAGWSYPGKTKRDGQPEQARPRRALRTSKHLEWTILVLLVLDIAMQVMSSFPVVGSTFWLINFVVDALLVGLVFLLIMTRPV